LSLLEAVAAKQLETPVIRHKSIVKGAASLFVKSLRKSGTGTDGAFTEGSYAIFMRHLIALGQIGTSFGGWRRIELWCI